MSSRPRLFADASAAALAVLLVVFTADAARAQGLLVDARPDARFRLPRPWMRARPQPQPGSYKIESLEINAQLKHQVARVQVSQTFVNTGSAQLEATFVFPLPYDGAVDRLTLMVDGKEFPAKLLSAEEARRRYEAIVRQNKDPALLEWVGSGMFQTSVFPIPPGAKRTVMLRYTQLIRQSQGLNDFLFPLSTAKYTESPLERLKLRATIESDSEIKNIYAASHAVSIDRPDDRHAVATYEAANLIPTEDFRLFYDATSSAAAASLVSYRPDSKEDGYFLLLAAPRIKQTDQQRPRKTVIFVADRSGSMSGQKIEQARGALTFVLNNLREGDLFNIIAYDSEIEAFRPELQKFDEQTRVAALGFVNGLYAGGSTNIDGALQRALGMLHDSQQPAYVIFLTDGLPTVGETNEAKIAAAAEKANRVGARLFAFGVGYDVNSRLLDRLARANFGQSEYVRPDVDIEAAVSTLYRRIGAPVMTDVSLAVDVEGASPAAGLTTSRIYPKGPIDLFAGDQAVLVGRYRTPGAAKIVLKGSVGGEETTLDFPADLTAKSADDGNSFIAKLWATRRVGEIVDEMDLKGRNEELVKELVSLATQHGILTPYTSFLADENAADRTLASSLRRAGRELTELERTDGSWAFRQRDAKSLLQRAKRPASIADGYGGGYGGDVAVPAGESLSADGVVVLGLAKTAGRGAVYYDAANDHLTVAQNVLNIGGKTFFRQGDRWFDSHVTQEQSKRARVIERFSDEYFQLVSRHGKRAAIYLTIEEPVCIELDGKVYQW